MKNKFKALIAIVVLVALGVVIYMSFFANAVFIKDKTLKVFSYNMGGGMSGGHKSVRITMEGDHALIKTESSEWHNEEPKVTEYAADKAVLDEINAVFWKYHMNRWNNKTFSKIFVADGESESYYFGFTEEKVRFSSQIYPKSYSSKLKEIDAVVEKYIESATKLSGE